MLDLPNVAHGHFGPKIFNPKPLGSEPKEKRLAPVWIRVNSFPLLKYTLLRKGDTHKVLQHNILWVSMHLR
jgi:hypothetical protein